VPAPTGQALGRALRLLRADVLSPEQLTFLGHGRAVDTTALKEGFGYTPRFSTAEAFEDYAVAHPGPLRRVPVPLIAETAISGLLEKRRTVRA
jgi:UDP-glucose 4-epimerase